MNLVKITIDSESFFIGAKTACKLLESDYKKPIAVNGLEHYYKDSLDAKYRRLAITEYTDFTLQIAKENEIPEK